MHNILEVKKLRISFNSTTVLKDVSFEIKRGEVLGIVGESGSGKSITSLAIMGLLPSSAKIEGNITYKEEDNSYNLLNNELQDYRGNKISMVFQEPMTSLNPSMKCGKQVLESINLHLKLNKKEAENHVLNLFEKVKLPNPQRIFNAYPHELSGGQRQRVMIAMAIACSPKLLIADEPTTALDVTVQKSILELLKELQLTENLTIIFISHDLGVISKVCDRVLVMHKGKLVEQGNIDDIFNSPVENYTKGLLACRPKTNVRLKKLPTVSDYIENNNPAYYEETKEERESKHKLIYKKPPILNVTNLSKYFNSANSFFSKGNTVKAVNKVSFDLFEGETLGLVGESGSGKTTLSRTLLLLEKPTEGEVFYKGEDLTKLSKNQMRALRKEIQIIFQDPFSSLNPRQTVGAILTEAMQIHKIGESHKNRLKIAVDLLQKVGLSKSALQKYPHEFSGGQRQRVGIARAISVNPKIIICDESVSALDVSVQAQILNLLNELKSEYNLSYIFISHDLSVVKYMSDRIIVLQSGEIKEYGDVDDIYSNPKSRYTKTLLESIPS